MKKIKLCNGKTFPFCNELRRKLAFNIYNFITNYRFRGSQRLGEFILDTLLPAPKGPTICHIKYGFNIIVDPVADKGVERKIYFRSIYEEGTIALMKEILRNGDTFIDVGCNIGLMSLAASQFVGHNGAVYAFEPHPDTFSILQDNIELNNSKNIFSYNIALGEKEEKVLIYSNMQVNRGSASLIKTSQNQCEVKEVAIMSLDDFIIEKGIKNIRMLKVDVEGWELEVFKGASQLLSGENAPIVCFEYSKGHALQNGQLSDLYKFIQSVNDYKLYKLEKGKEIPSKLMRITCTEDLPEHDNLFCFPSEQLENIQRNIFAQNGLLKAITHNLNFNKSIDRNV